MLTISDDFANHQSAWERAKDIPGSVPLRRHPHLPECLSPQEIAELICDYPDDIKAVCLLVERAISAGDLQVSLIFCCTEAVHPGEVVRNLHDHIRILEARLRQFELDYGF